MINKIKCFFVGHIRNHSVYINAEASYSSPTQYMDNSGAWKTKRPIFIGFMYTGIGSPCVRCEQVQDVESDKYPILMPEFPDNLQQ